MRVIVKEVNGFQSLSFKCPGCGEDHGVFFGTTSQAEKENMKRPRMWAFNGSAEFPTIRPSINYASSELTEPRRICHSMITNGKICFFNESTHSLAGQTVWLAEIEKGKS